MTVLFVCTGNTCRSPMAEGLFNRRAAERGSAHRAESCGLSAVPGPVTDRAVSAAARYGADIGRHRARRVSREMLLSADRICCMTRAQCEALAAMYPEFADRCSALDAQDISDPYGGSQAVYAETAAQIDRAVLRLLETLGGELS